MQEKQLTFEGKRLSYRVSGTGPAAVVLLHGFAEDGTIWENLWHEFPDCLLIIPDLPGSGRSEMQDSTTMETLANAVRAIIVHETGTLYFREGEPGAVVLIGHSMGGYVTLAFAEAYPQMLAGFGLFHSTAMADTDEKKQNREKGIRVMEEKGTEEFVRATTANLFSPDTKTSNPGLVEKHSATGYNFSVPALVSYYRAMMARPDRTEVLTRAAVPVLFVMGRFDNAVPMAEGLRQCHLPQKSYIHVLDHSGHLGMLEEPEPTKKMIRQFINSIHFSTR